MAELERGRAAGGSGCSNRPSGIVPSGATCWCPSCCSTMSPGEYENGYATAATVAEIGERFGDVNLVTFALYARGRAQLRLGQAEEGLRLLDEAMVAVVAGELSSSLFTGLI